MSSLEALSPLDGRYYAKLAPVREYFSELALIQARVRVEVAYLRALGKVIDTGVEVQLSTSIQVNARRIKVFEKNTNHDVKYAQIRECSTALLLAGVGTRDSRARRRGGASISGKRGTLTRVRIKKSE